MKKLMAWVASLAAVVPLLVFGAATPAQAATYWTPYHCVSNSGQQVCWTFEWRDQNDGNGVFVKGIQLDINDDCGEMEGDYPVVGLAGDIRDQDGSPVLEVQTVADMVDCHAYRTLNIKGPDTGAAMVTMVGKMRVNLQDDWWWDNRCVIRPNNPDDCYNQNVWSA